MTAFRGCVFEDPKYRDRLETLRDRSTWLPSQFINISSNLVTAIMSLAGVVLIIAYLSPVLALILILSTAPFAFVHNHYNELEWEYHKDYAPVRRRAAYARHILLGRRSAKEVRLFGLGSFFLNLYQSAFKGLYSVLRNIQVRSSRWSVLTGFLSGAGTGLGYFWILSQSHSSSFSVGIYRCTWELCFNYQRLSGISPRKVQTRWIYGEWEETFSFYER